MSNPHLRPHAAHSPKTENSSTANLLPRKLPSQLLHPQSEEKRAILEELDDAIFLAISGDAQALVQTRMLWPQVIAEIGWEQVEESREQYLRYAIDTIQRSESEEMRSPERAIAALEIISLLTMS